MVNRIYVNKLYGHLGLCEQAALSSGSMLMAIKAVWLSLAVWSPGSIRAGWMVIFVYVNRLHSHQDLCKQAVWSSGSM